MNNFDDLSQDIFEEDDVINSAAGGILPAASGPTGGLFQDGVSEEASAEAEQAADLGETELTSLSDDADQEPIEESSSDDAADSGDQETTSVSGTATAGLELTGQRAAQEVTTPDGQTASSGTTLPTSASPEVLHFSANELNSGAAAEAAAARPEPVTGSDVVSSSSEAAPGAAGTLATLANYLNDGLGANNDYWSESSRPSPFFNVTSSGTNAKSGVIHYNVDGFSGAGSAGTDSNGLTAARADMIRHALNVYEDILGINFVETTSSSTAVTDIFFSDNQSGAYANASKAVDGSVAYSWVNIAASWSGSTSNIGSYSFQTALHEIGHVLGLGHQGNYNGSASYSSDAIWANDSWQQTMMSYFDQTENTSITADYARLIGPMAVDWLALDNIYDPQGYGIDDGWTTGNTTWGFNSSWYTHPSGTAPGGGYANSAYASLSTLLDTNAVAIVDGGGTDTLDLSGFSNNTVIDVSEAYASSTVGSISSVAGLTGNLTIAVGTIIENVVGGAGSELIYGNGADNNMDGGGGNDSIYGYGGNDSLYGGTGNDRLYGSSGNDYLFGNADDDYLDGSSGNDYLSGSSGNDTLQAGSGVDTLYGGSGNDYLYHSGLQASGYFDGDGGTDYLLSNVAWNDNVLFDLTAGRASIGVTLYDTLVDLEHVYVGGGADATGNASANILYAYDIGANSNNTFYGMAGNDSLYGNIGNDYLDGGSGDDYMSGGDDTDSLYGGSGVDTLYGGNGNDYLYHSALQISARYDGDAGIDYLISNQAWVDSVLFDLTAGRSSYSGTLYDYLVDLEHVYVGGSADVTGDASANYLYGYSSTGTNTFLGMGGNDTLVGNGGNDSLDGGTGVDSILGGDGNDTINTGGQSGDYADGGIGDDLISGGLNSQILRGGDGNDTIYGDSATPTSGIGDSLDGGAGNDLIVGANGADTIDGGAGNDTILGNGGNDTILGGDGADSLVGGSGNDTLDGSDGTGTYQSAADTLLGEAGNDVLRYSMDGSGNVGTYDGGTGTDTFEVTSTTLTGRHVNLAAGQFQLGSSNRGNLISIENVTVYNNNQITGDANANVLTAIGDFDNLIDGGAGNDTINSGEGTDTVDAGAGDDLIIDTASFTANVATYDGGTGIDTFRHDNTWNNSVMFNLLTGFASYLGTDYDSFTNIENLEVGGSASIIGDNGDNVLTALSADTNHHNVMDGNGGNDTMDGGGGNDTMSGGLGNDSMIGGIGNDSMDGNSGADTLLGGDGNDTINAGGSGGEYVDGGSGDDLISGGLNGQTLLGGIGNDTIYGDTATPTSGVGDTIDGGAGNDSILAANGHDSIDGGAGNDTITSGAGNDTINAGNDNDTVDAGAGNDLIIDTQTILAGSYMDVYDGGAGIDTFRHDLNWNSGVMFNLLTGFSSFSGSNSDTLINIENLEIGGSASIIGDNNANVLTALSTSHHNVMDGNGGNDTMDGGGGNDTMDGGSGNDSMIGGIGNDSMTGGTGNDTLLGDAGNDFIVGGSGDDTLLGGAGNDTLQGGFNSDSVDGGAGDDLIQVLDGEYYDNVDGGTGNDTLDHTGHTSTGTFNFLTGILTSTYTNTGTTTLANIETYLDGSGSNTIYSTGDGTYMANEGDDTVYAGLTSTSESLDGGTGNDWLDTTSFTGHYAVNLTSGVTNFGGESFTNFENLTSGAGNDTLVGTSGDNVIDGGTGHDNIIGGSGDDSLIGGTGNDTLDGSDGTGTFVSTNADTLEGGGGNDVLRYSMSNTGGGAIGLFDGGNGTDTFEVTSTTIGSRHVDLTIGEFQVSGINRGTLISIENVTVYNASSVNGDGGANVITGIGNFANTFDGSGGADSIDGGGGNDYISGGYGNDTLLGGDGDDTLEGGASADVLDGGAGINMLSYASDTSGVDVNLSINAASGGHAAGDVITGFRNLQGGSGADSLTGTASANVLIGGGGSDTLNGLGGSDVLDGGDAADVLLGGGSNDTISGGNGADTMYGGSGNDSLSGDAAYDKLLGGSGNDTMDGGIGNDTLEGGVGADIMDGGAGAGDLLSYESDTAGVSVNLGTGVTGGGHAAGDVITGFEDVLGGTGDDNLTGSSADNVLTGGVGNDTMDGGLGNDLLQGGAGDDDLSGGGGDDHVKGDGGNDIVNGGAGNDTVKGGSGADTIDGGSDNDLVLGGGQNDSMSGGSGNDTMYGGGGKDKLFGGSGNDTLNGGGGNDTLTGDSGDDKLTGAGGSDDFIFANNFGTDIISDFSSANGEDIDLSAVTNIISFNDLLNNHLVNNGGFAQIVDGANSILLDGVAFADVGFGQLYSGDDFIF